MAATTYFEYVIDPVTGNQLEVRDRYAREQLAHKVEKTIVNSLPSKPTDYESWVAMEPFLYYVPISGQPNDYQVWTLFFTGDASDPSAYTNTNNYEWAQIADTDVSLDNFSTHGHTHEVIPETEVEDHDYTPQGQVVAEFEGGSSTTSENTHNHTFTPNGTVSGGFSGTEGTTSSDTHNHTFTPHGNVSASFSGSEGTTSEHTHTHTITPAGNVSGNFSGTEGTTGSNTTGVSLNKSKKKLTTKSVNIAPATAVNFTGSTTDAQRATGALEALSTYDATKAVFSGISVDNGILSFVIKKMTTANTVSGLQASVDASKVTLDSQGTVSGQALATGGVEDDNNGALLGTDTTVSDSGHTHSFTPSGSLTGLAFTGTQGTTSSDSHTHTITPAGSVSASFTGTQESTGDHTHTHTMTPTGSLTNLAFKGTAGTTGSNTHTHTVTAAGSINAAFRGLRANLKHKVNNKKVRTAPDQEDEGSHVFDWYGIEFDEDGTDPIKTRVGNMDMHRMLPIQTKMRRCILNDDGTVNYYLDDRDSTKRAGGQEGYVTSVEDFISKVETDEIRDETEFIDKVEGKSVAWNQLVASDATSVTVTSGHKYYAVISGTASIATSSGTAINVTGGTDMVIDLTLLGIDSFTTTAQVEEWLLKNKGSLGYFPYTAGEIDNVNLRGFKTVGFNQWDEEWEIGDISGQDGGKIVETGRIRTKNYIPVLGNINYYVKIDSPYFIRLFYYDANKNFISSEGGFGSAGIRTTPANCSFVLFAVSSTYGATYNHDICINISDPKRNGEYEPYNAHTYDLDIPTLTGINSITGERELMFPRGMKMADNAGTVRDLLYRENGVTKAVKKVGDEDLGTLGNWALYNNVFNASITDKVAGGATTSDSNIICSKYNTGLVGGSTANYGKDKIIWVVNGTQEIYVRDSAYVDATSFKTAMDGVYLNYELATPITYTDIQDANGNPVMLPIEMEVEHNGTITVLPQVIDEEELPMVSPTLTLRKYVLTQGANLDGSDGQVMVEIPEHWRKVYTYLNGSTSRVRAMLSPYPQETTGWLHVKKGYVSAYEASIIAGKLCSVSNIVNLTLSVVNGKIQASCDVSTATGQSDITSQLPTTSQTIDAFRTAARARGNEGGFKWNQNVYEQNLSWIWLYYIEYANLNSQDPFNIALDVNGYHQGGLGEGATTVVSANWNTFNSYKPFIPCGITNCLGNQSGEVLLVLPSGLGGGTIKVNSYRGIELPFGHIWKFADGIKYLGDGTQQAVLRCDNPANYSSAASSTNYTSIGNNCGGNGWKTKMMIGDDGDINCKEVGGSSNLAYCDYNYQAHASGTYYCCLLGGITYHGTYAGLGCVGSHHDVGYSNVDVGSRLNYFNK